jgi:hypothetical protein
MFLKNIKKEKKTKVTNHKPQHVLDLKKKEPWNARNAVRGASTPFAA